MSKRDIIRIYNKDACKFEKQSNKYFSERRGYELSKLCKGFVLEVGAGCGFATKYIKKKTKVVAIDISINMLKITNKRYNVPVIVADAEYLPFKNNVFDSVVASELIYYLDNPRLFFNESKRVLQRKGIFAVTSLNQIWYPLDIIRVFLGKLGLSFGYFDEVHYSMFYRNQLKNMFRSAGFTNIKDKGIILFPFPFMDWLNKKIEKTFLNKTAICNIFSGEKDDK